MSSVTSGSGRIRERPDGKEHVMSGGGWARRDVVRGLAFAALACMSVVPATPGDAAGADPATPRDREARRRWALARMDEMAGERLRCRERFKIPRQVRECETEFERRHRAYNEVYLEASRERSATP
jgi:hypothetical protein